MRYWLSGLFIGSVMLMGADATSTSSSNSPTFHKDVLPILQRNCFKIL